MSNILTPKNRSSSSTVRVRVQASLAAEIEDVKRQAAARGLVFNVGSIFADALARAVHQARRELAALDRAAERPPEGRGEEPQK